MGKRAFTLIELLIVVAIIAILAAIAVPNFLEAQVRAKVSRAQADMRSVATALEAYHVDYNKYPTMLEPGFTGGVAPLANSDLKWWYVPNSLSTPIAYISSATMQCPFGGNWERKDNFPDNIWRRYGYENIPELMGKRVDFPILANRYRDEALVWSGMWRLQCVGPDTLWNPSRLYDPTNGTVSEGDIIRTQASSSGNTNPDNLAP
ncbi:MAG: prepilin-type N-terminal cleavage/methylation domain-containing protein [Candidatus Sumerlaeia bacterium]|nr:prepilin-type N-terminal cleavage/methylation domain-containing protein [Candidatus Sumerlaeia bacterium]